MIQLAHRIDALQRLKGPAEYSSNITHPNNNTTCETTPHHNIGGTGLAVVTYVARHNKQVWYILIYARPSSARDSNRWPQCAVSMPSANCCARCGFGDSRVNPSPRGRQQWDGGERPARESHPLPQEEYLHHQLTRCSKKNRYLSMCVWLGEAAGRVRPLWLHEHYGEAVSHRLLPYPTLFS